MSMQEMLHGELHLSNYPTDKGIVHGMHHQQDQFSKAGGTAVAICS